MSGDDGMEESREISGFGRPLGRWPDTRNESRAQGRRV